MSKVTSPFSKIDRELKKDAPDMALVAELYAEVQSAFAAELAWRQAANADCARAAKAFLDEVQQGVAIRTLPMIPTQYRRPLAWCQAQHQDISLRF